MCVCVLSNERRDRNLSLNPVSMSLKTSSTRQRFQLGHTHQSDMLQMTKSTARDVLSQAANYSPVQQNSDTRRYHNLVILSPYIHNTFLSHTSTLFYSYRDHPRFLVPITYANRNALCVYFLSNLFMYIPPTFRGFNPVRMLEECSSRIV